MLISPHDDVAEVKNILSPKYPECIGSAENVVLKGPYVSLNKFSSWQASPATLKWYVSQNERDNLRNYLGEYYKIFCRLGMHQQATAVLSPVSIYVENNEHFPVTPESVACSLGKLHGFITTGDTPFLSPVSNERLTDFLWEKLCPSRHCLREAVGGYFCWNREEPYTLKEVLKMEGCERHFYCIVRNLARLNYIFVYASRIYDAYFCVFPKNYLSLIEKLKGTFDCFSVLVPSVDLVSRFLNSFHNSFFVKDGSLICFKSEEEFQTYVDNMLIRAEQVHPVLMGTKDCQTYVIGYLR